MRSKMFWAAGASLIALSTWHYARAQSSGNQPVTQSQIDQPNGVAGLNGNAAMGQFVNTPGLDSPTFANGDLLSTGRANFRSMIDGQTITRITGSHRQDNPAGEDAYTDPDGVVIGGYAPGRGSHVVMTCQDEGGTNLGACLSLWNSNDVYTGNRPGISPTTGQQIANYINTLDSVVFDNGTKNSTPKIVSGDQIKDSAGTKHSIFFTAGSVFIYPALMPSDQAKIKQFQTITSNVSTPQYVNSLGVYGFYGVNGFSGMINNWAFGVSCPSSFSSGNTCDRIDVDQWVIPGQPSTSGQNLNPQNYSGNPRNIDNHYDLSVTDPAIYIGARSKQFNLLDTCSIVDNDTSQNADSAHSLIRECENGEYDNELSTNVSGKYHFNGLTIGLDSHVQGKTWWDGSPQTDGYNAWPDLKSWAIYLGGQFPNLLQLEPFTDPFVWSIKGNTIGISNPISAGSSTGSKALAMSVYKQSGSTSMREDHWEECDAPQGQTCQNHQNMSWRIGLRVAAVTPDQESQTAPNSGAAGANLSFGGDGSIGLCSATGNCTTFAPDSAGITTSFINVFSIGSQYKNTPVTFTSPLVENYTIQAQAYQENLTTPSSSSASCKAGQFTDDTNYHYVCVSTNKWRRSALSDF